MRLGSFPYVVALTVCDGSWSDSLRAALVALSAIGWSLAFYPWRRRRYEDASSSSSPCASA